jgi:hypothetical protein
MKPIADLTPPELRVQLALAFGTRFFVPPFVRAGIVPVAVAVDDTHPDFIYKVIGDGWGEVQEPEDINWELLCDFDPTTSMSDAWALVTRHVIPAGFIVRSQTPEDPEYENYLGKFMVNIDKPSEYTGAWYDTTGELALSRAILAWAREHKL